EEAVDEGRASQRGQFLDGPGRRAGAFLGGVHHQERVLLVQGGSGDELAVHRFLPVTPPRRGRVVSPTGSSSTASSPSVSVSRTRTTSCWEVGRFLPT